MSPSTSKPVILAATAAGALLLGLIVFRPGRASDVREWTPADHDQPPNAQGQPPPKTKGGQGKSSSPEELADLAWAKTCAGCHGPTGHGDGPQSAMAKPPDLTLAEWQEKVSDAQIADVIRKGKGEMKPNDLPPAVIQGLVKRVRALRGR